MDELKKYPNINWDKCYGADISAGWYTIISQLTHAISHYCEKENITVDVLQIKEKFGSLRYYVSINSDNHKDFTAINTLIMYAEWLSESACIDCGNSAKIENHNGWYVPVCDNCNKNVK